jgi:vancomycin resistance protein YoaR
MKPRAVQTLVALVVCAFTVTVLAQTDPPADPLPTPEPPPGPTVPINPVPVDPAPLEPPAPPVAPAPVKPPTPPAVVRPKPVPPLAFVLETTEPELRAGRLTEARIARRFPLPAASVRVSRERRSLSSGLEDALKSLERNVGRPAVDARWVKDGTAWVARGQSGWTVDAGLSRAYLLEAVRFGKTEARLVVRRTPPARTVKFFFDNGFRFHFGGGDSSAAGSPAFRVQNILASARQIDGVRLERGAVFDFNRRVRISARLGFVDGYVIRGSLLDKDIGGGVCQTSTTVWRAAYAAGLPILERHQHSYSVSYYDPPGMEATVYAPSKNLRFRNDSGGALWFQTDWDATTKTLALNFFGRAPDRRVQITQPNITAVRTAPRDRFVPDRTLKLGEVKLVSGASDGMTSSILRAVTYNGGRVLRDVTRSRYVPWGAIYAVNPRDPRVRR